MIIKDFFWVTSGIRTHDIQNHNPIESNRMQLVVNKLNIAHKTRLKQSLYYDFANILIIVRMSES